MAPAALENVRAITFDMYGTVLDLQASFVHGFGEFLKTHNSARDPAEMVRLWEATYLRESMVDTMIGRGRTPFERIRRDCLGQVFSTLGIANTLDDVEKLLTTNSRVSLFPDVLEGMLALKGKLTLVVLSNGDLDSLERAVSGLSIPVDSVISAEQAGVYKPHAAVYRFAAEHLNLPPNQILHVAAHPWDVRGAKASGLLGAYVNRESVPYRETAATPELEVSKLTQLAARLGI